MQLPPDEAGLVRARTEIRCRGERRGKRPENNLSFIQPFPQRGRGWWASWHQAGSLTNALPPCSPENSGDVERNDSGAVLDARVGDRVAVQAKT